MRILIFTLFVGVICMGCSRFYADKYSYVEGFTQGTTYHITFLNKSGKDYSHPIQNILDSFDLSLSIYNPKSIISRMNRNEAVLADAWFTRVFNKSMEISSASDGAFDITVGPLVNAWGFGIAPKMKVDSTEIDSLKNLVGYKKVKLVNGRLIKQNPNSRLDVNAIAQGYSVDVICGFFEENGIRDYLVEIGGELRARGRNPKGEYWHVGIDRPVEGNNTPGSDLQATLKLKNRALATSGNYRKFYEEGGVKYGHHIDPATGYPARQNILSATVMSKEDITSDGWGTAFMVMGLEKSKKVLTKHSELEVYFVYNDSVGNYKIYASKGFSECLIDE
jgi:thiamine biosynthesis lipoprotein